MKHELKIKLLEMLDKDQRTRQALLDRGVLSDDYHAEMESVHLQNAKVLEQIIDDIGWPTAEIVGAEAAHAAWVILQHAISTPDFQKKCLKILKEETQKGSIELSLVAALEDRILVLEGKPQIYGTQFDWDNDGQLSPNPIQSLDEVDQLRKLVGLPSLEETTRQIRQRAFSEGDRPPKDKIKKQQDFMKWLLKVGWRK